MRFAFISGLKMPWEVDNDFVAAVDFLSGNFDSECKRYHHSDDLSAIQCVDVVCGHSLGAYEALEVFNQKRAIGALILDYVDKGSLGRQALLTWPTAAFPGVKSIHRPVTALEFPRSVGVANADDEELAIGHAEFPEHPRVRELLVRYASDLGWN